MNRVVDLIFFIDMILQFFMMYPVETNLGVVMEYRQRYIAMNYVKKWFVIDFLSILPFDMVGLVADNESVRRMNGIKIIRILRLLKLMKVSKFSRIFHRFEVRMSITYQKLQLYIFFSMLLLLS